MDRTLITPSFTTLYAETEVNPLHLSNTRTTTVCSLYRAKIEEAIRLIRPHWTVTLDGAVYGPKDWQPLTQSEADELFYIIDSIDVDAIIAEATR